MKKDLKKIRPYGDHLDDGKMQLSFTLPVPAGEQAKEAARLYIEKLGLERPEVSWMEGVGEEFTFFVAYGHAVPHIDYSRIVIPKPAFPNLSFEELVAMAQEKIHKKIVIIGATTGTDAHTVGIDAILSIKGIAGEKGLEYYPIFKVINLRAQVDNQHLIDQAIAHQADAILVSKMVTQQDQHLHDLKLLSHMIQEEKRLAPSVVKIVGGPRMDHRLAKSIGFDAGFGPGTKPSEVANFIVHELSRRPHHETPHRMEDHGPHQAPPKRRSLFGWLGGRGKDS